MNLLLDTHVLLWWLADAAELTTPVRDAIRNPDHLVYVSAVSIWEIAIKQALGKLTAPRALPEVIRAQPFEPLQMTIDHAFKVAELPNHHRDPFDRLLIAQCLVDGLTIVTGDTDIAKYDVPTLLC
ncbi:MAG: type II toxin-antitoxin system VapC family toxin [Acidobacteriota bacterium]|nr:type II toxin-antitoxin system VapC family toxin [Acidobacteriota bacterium]